MNKRGKSLTVLLLASVLALGPISATAKSVEEKPSGFEMITDLVIARPLGIALFAVSTTAYVATLPFSLAGGNAGDAGRNMVLEPAKEAFVRCLGCRRIGRKEKITEGEIGRAHV